MHEGLCELAMNCTQPSDSGKSNVRASFLFNLFLQVGQGFTEILMGGGGSTSLNLSIFSDDKFDAFMFFPFSIHSILKSLFFVFIAAEHAYNFIVLTLKRSAPEPGKSHTRVSYS